MNGTIRDYIKWCVRWRMAIGIGGWVVVAASVGTRVDSPIVSILGFLAFAGAILAVQWIKCPRCATRLGQVAMLIGPFVQIRKPMNFCPYCGVNLDEPRAKQAPDGQQAPYNPIS